MDHTFQGTEIKPLVSEEPRVQAPNFQPSDIDHRWKGPSTDIRNCKPMSNEALAALRNAAAAKGKPLSDKESADVLKKVL
jgi:hypothetical protein